jgi:hypothetical protein
MHTEERQVHEAYLTSCRDRLKQVNSLKKKLVDEEAEDLLLDKANTLIQHIETKISETLSELQAS